MTFTSTLEMKIKMFTLISFFLNLINNQFIVAIEGFVNVTYIRQWIFVQLTIDMI